MAMDDVSYRKFTSKMELEKSLNELDGLLKGVTIDSELNNAERAGILKWVEKHQVYANKHPFNELFPMVENALAVNIMLQENADEIFWLCNRFTVDNTFFDLVTADLQRLSGILLGILEDGKISNEEVKALEFWLEENSHLASSYPYDEIHALVISALKYRSLTQESEDLLKVMFTEFIDKSELSEDFSSEIEELRKHVSIQGVCTADPVIHFDGRKFCFTGFSSKFSRMEFENIILSKGAIFKNSVTKDLDYLIVGNEGNPCWAYACYGRKVEHAIELRKTGHPVQIIHETDFMDKLQED